ncbi:MAG: DUF1499 domain-containing protein [Pseudomonadota bacterium]
MQFLEFETLTRPASPNTFLLAPEGLCQNAEPDRAPPAFGESAKDLFAILSRIVRDDGSFRQIDEDRESLRLRFVAVTSFLRFKDDVDVQVIPANDSGSIKSPGSTLAVYSRSRVGYSDLGANEKRVGMLLNRLASATHPA